MSTSPQSGLAAAGGTISSVASTLNGTTSTGSSLPGIPGRVASNVNPGKTGWYLLELADGSAGLVPYKTGTGWGWGGIGEPAQNVTHYTWLGTSYASVSANSQVFGRAITHLPGALQRALIGALDVGGPMNGIAAVYSPAGHASKGTPALGSSATPVNNVANAIGNAASGVSLPSIGGVFGVLASLAFWKGIGLVLAGAAILVFAAVEFKDMAV